MLLTLFVFLITPQGASSFNYSLTDQEITSFYVSRDEIYIVTPKKILVTNSRLYLAHSYVTNLQSSSWFYYNATDIIMCGVRIANNPCCYRWDKTTQAQITAVTEKATCGEYMANIRYYGYTDSWRDKFFVISQHSYNGSGSSRILINNDLTIESYSKFHGSGIRLVIVSPSFTYTKQFLIAIKSPFVRELRYIKATAKNIDTMTESIGSLFCGGDSTASGSATLPPEILDIDISLINYTMIMHFVITRTSKICVFSEDANSYDSKDADLHLSSNLEPVVSRKTSLYNGSRQFLDMVPFTAVTVNGGIAIYYADGAEVFKVM